MTRSLLNTLFPPVVAPARQRWPIDTPTGLVHRRWTPDPVDAYCARCGATTGPGEATPSGCGRCADRRLAWDRCVRLGAYGPPLAFWVRLFKFHGKWPWGRWFGTRLAGALPAGAPDRSLLVPVPLHWTRRWGRGYNQAALLAGAVARAKAWPVQSVLTRRRGRPQITLTASERRANVAGKFALRRRAAGVVRGRDIWLVDDVLTTGHTLETCARLLRRAGARSVQVAVVAVAQRHEAGLGA